MRALAVGAALILMAQHAEATPPPPPQHVVRAARERFERANRLYNEGRYTEALHLYQAAYDLLPSPDVLFNLALAREKTFDYEGCALGMQQYLRSPQTEASRARATSRLEHCRARAVIPVRVSSMPPSAALFVGDGRARTPRGRTPARLELAPGTYTLSAELPGHHAQRQQVVVEIGARPEIDFILERLSSLRIEADVSGAQVQIGDGPLEDAPVQRELPAGPYRVRVQKPGHRAVLREVRVEPGQQISLMVALPALPRALTVETTVPAHVRIDGSVAEPAPAHRRLGPGLHRLEVTAPGRSPFLGDFRMPDDADVTLRVQLERPRRLWQNVIALSVLGAAVGTAVAGGAFGIMALEDEHAYKTGTPTLELRDEGRRHARIADGLFITAAALAVAGVVYYVLSRPRPSRLSVER